MNTNTTNTITQEGYLKVTRHVGPGQHRATRKSQTDELTSATENRRRTRTAKQAKGGRYRADTTKVNLTWFIGFIVLAAVAFTSIFSLLLGMSMSEPVVTLQTRTQTITREIDVPSIPAKCMDAMDSADKGFDIALEQPKVRLIKTGKKHEKSVNVPYSLKFAKAQQAKVYQQQGKFNTDKALCLSADTDAKQISESIQYDTK